MPSNITLRDGLYDPSARFEFTNITDTDFTSQWNGSPIEIKAKETVVVPHYLAVKLTTELVDRIFQDRAKAEEDEMRPKVNNPYWQSRIGMQASIPAMRDPYEKQVMKKAENAVKGIESQIMRSNFKDQLMADMAREPGVAEEAIPEKVQEFAQITSQKQDAPDVKEALVLPKANVAKK